MAANETPSSDESEKEEVIARAATSSKDPSIQQSSQDSRNIAQETLSTAEHSTTSASSSSTTASTPRKSACSWARESPSRSISGRKDVPRIGKRIGGVGGGCGRFPTGARAPRRRVQKANEILVVMEQVLSHMHTLEDYNELVKQLEGISTIAKKFSANQRFNRVEEKRVGKLKKENGTWPFLRSASWRPASAGSWQWLRSALERGI